MCEINLKGLPKKYFEKTIEDEFKLFTKSKEDNTKINVTGKGMYNTENPTKNNLRYYLELNFEPEKKRGSKILIAIMMNPSNTFPKIGNKKSKIDPTVKNVLRIAYACKQYSKVVVLNCYPQINGNSKDNTIVKNENNTNFIKTFIENNKESEILIAWGTKIEHTVLSEIKRIVKNKKTWAYDKNEKTHTPSHPSSYNYTKIQKFIKSKDAYSKIKKVGFDSNNEYDWEYKW